MMVSPLTGNPLSAPDPICTTNNVFDLLIIGGGVVGLAVLRAATLAGYKCIAVERHVDLLAEASGSNSGIVCTGVDATPGTLERALIRDSIAQIRSYCRQMNVPSRPCGSLVCEWDKDQSRLQDVLNESLDAGDTHASILSPDEVFSMEPNLNPSCQGAVHIPGEIVVDPWLYSVSLAVHAQQNGATILTGFEVDSKRCSLDQGVWTIHKKCPGPEHNDAHMTTLKARAVVNAAGLWSDLVQNSPTVPPASWKASPRRGQYRVFASPKPILTHPIQPIPTQFSKGVFVFSTIYDQIVVGPTASDQDSRTDRTVDSTLGDDLEQHLKRVLNVDDLSVVGEYVGIRPATNHRDYQIHMDVSKKWIACAGIRSTGTSNIYFSKIVFGRSGFSQSIGQVSRRALALDDTFSISYNKEFCKNHNNHERFKHALSLMSISL